MPDNSAGNFIDDLSNGDKAILGGSLAVIIAMFLPWYSASFAGASDSSNGWHRWGLLTLIAWLGVVLLWLFRGPLQDAVKLPAWNITDAMLFMILGALEMLGAVLYWIDGSSSIGDLRAFGFSSGPSFGLFIALVGGALTAFGGYLKQSEPQGAGRVSSPSNPGGYGAPPPPPQSYGAPAPAAPPSAPPAPPQSYGAPPPPTAPPSEGEGAPPSSPPPAG